MLLKSSFSNSFSPNSCVTSLGWASLSFLFLILEKAINRFFAFSSSNSPLAVFSIKRVADSGASRLDNLPARVTACAIRASPDFAEKIELSSSTNTLAFAFRISSQLLLPTSFFAAKYAVWFSHLPNDFADNTTLGSIFAIFVKYVINNNSI